MQVPNRNTPITRCESASQFTQSAMRAYPAKFEPPPDVAARLESLAGTLETGTAPLLAAQAAYRASVIALISMRVEVKLVDLWADDVVRSVQRAAEDSGPAIAGAVFPGGVTPIIKPVGKTQVDQLHALENRVNAQTGWAVRDAQLARVVTVRTQYETALENRKNGMLAAASQRALRDAAKEDFLDGFASVAAGVKALFPRDRKRQDVFFDVLRTRPAAEDDADEPDEPSDPTPYPA